jgi:hypothetical protein
MKISRQSPLPAVTLIQTACMLALTAGALSASAGEGYKLRQSPVGLFGGEMAAPADNPGFFGTAALTYSRIYKVVDDAGNNIAVAPRSIPLPTGVPTGGRVPNGTYTLNVPAGTIGFSQNQTQLNLLGGYLTESTWADGRLAFAVNLPLIQQNRSFTATQALGTVSPAVPAPLQAAVGAVAAGANAQVQSGVAAQVASQNTSVTGLGDAEVSALWVRHKDRLKIAAGASLFLPTGAYDQNRGPNPGFGRFYTLRPGVAVSYALNPGAGSNGWDSGVTIAGRLSYGINSRNTATDYRSGNFLYAEAGVVKVSGNFAFGANITATQQTTDDSGTGATLGGLRYRNYSAGPFLSYKLPGKDAGFNLHFSQNFGSRNALVAQSLQLRFIKAW